MKHMYLQTKIRCFLFAKIKVRTGYQIISLKLASIVRDTIPQHFKRQPDTKCEKKKLTQARMIGLLWPTSSFYGLHTSDRTSKDEKKCERAEKQRDDCLYITRSHHSSPCPRRTSSGSGWCCPRWTTSGCCSARSG